MSEPFRKCYMCGATCYGHTCKQCKKKGKYARPTRRRVEQRREQRKRMERLVIEAAEHDPKPKL